MSVYPPASSSRDPSDERPRTRPAADRPARRPTGPARSTTPPNRPHQSALDWARQRFARPTRRRSGAEQRVARQLEQLGTSWRVVEWPPVGAGSGEAAFLVVGPGGLYSVSIVDHGRQRVMLAGDVVQIQGRRPPHIARARREARAASEALTAAVGTPVPVEAVLTFVGTGPISAHGLPTGCLVVVYRELDRLLLAAGHRISPATARKLADIASHPATWGMRWRAGIRTAGDNGTSHR